MLCTLDVKASSKTILLAIFLHHENILLDNYRTVGADSIRAHIKKIYSLEDRNYGPKFQEIFGHVQNVLK